MIIDPNGLAALVGQATGGESSVAESRHQSDEDTERTTLLVFRAGSSGPKAVPLSLVARLEEFEGEQIETVAGQTVIQYRGRLTPLIPINPSTPIGRIGRQAALVFSNEERVMALMVDEIIDIVEANVDMQLASDTPGIVGSSIISGKATDLIDTAYYVKQAFPDWFGSAGRSMDFSDTTRILFVDDSAFFRNMLTPLLQVAGYDVTTVASAADAIALCEHGESFDVIVSDLEMPGMNGFDFASWVKSEPSWCNTPMVALSSLAQAVHLNRAQQCGFDQYLTKFDREALLSTLSQTLTYARRAA